MATAIHRFTRQQLYDLVWSEPMKLLASRVGISDVALAKRCRKADIPVPARGYWAKRQAGKRTAQVELPIRPPGMPDEVVVGGGGYYWSQGLTEAEILGPLPPPPSFAEPITEVRHRVRKLIGKVSIPKTFNKIHPLISRLLEEDERRREKQRTSSYTFSWDAPLFDAPLERRRLRIVNSLFLAVANAGAKPFIRGRDAQELGITIGEQHVSFALNRVSERGRSNRVGHCG
jgi:hypothetical protein